jgi:trehalose-6-phosphatase
LNESHAPEQRQRADAALRHLAVDRRNEIWIVGSNPVNTVEETYGRIPHLNLAGLNGSELSQHNRESVVFTDAGRIEALEGEARRIFSGMSKYP